MLFGRNARIRAGNIHQAEQRKTVTLCELHQTHRLAVALGVRHAEVPFRALLDVTSLLVADQSDGATVEAPDADHDGGVVGAAAVPVELDPVLEEPLDVIERIRAILVPRELDRPPDLLVGRRGLDALQLTLQLLEVGRQPRAAEQVEATQTRQPLA